VLLACSFSMTESLSYFVDGGGADDQQCASVAQAKDPADSATRAKTFAEGAPPLQHRGIVTSLTRELPDKPLQRLNACAARPTETSAAMGGGLARTGQAWGVVRRVTQ